MAKLRVSVVIPTYNRGHLIHRALGSALQDIESDDELIVVDDGSSDATEDVVRKFGDQRVRYIRQEHSGAGAARNRGTLEARHELVAYLDSDDEWIRGKTALQRGFFTARSDVLFCFTNFARVYRGVRYARDIDRWHTDGRAWDEIMGLPSLYSAIAELPSEIADFPVYVGDIYRGEMRTNYILTSCLMVRAPTKGDVIRFSTTVRTYEDWACFGHLARRGLGGFLDHETAIQHGHSGPRLTDADGLTRIDARLAVLSDVWGSDAEFLSKHRHEYEALRRELQLLKVGYRVLAALPSPVLAMMTVARRWLNLSPPGAPGG